MKTVAIVTIYDSNPNYGNKLQNYASVQILKKMGYKVRTLITEPQSSVILIRIKCLINAILGYKFRSKKTQLVWKKQIRFQKFNEKYLNPDDAYIKKNSVGNYDFYCIGSDQVWNPEGFERHDFKKDLFLLTFTSSEKKVCMAPSFGVETLPCKWIEWFKEQLSTYKYLSVREEAGAKIIGELTGKKANVVIDPTLMVEKNEWLKIAKKPNVFPDDAYVLTYFIGGMRSDVRKQLEEYALEKNLKVYNLLDVSQPDLYITDPCEFLYLISHASLVLTDSFHACVFSILFSIPFYVYNRLGVEESMNSRIDTLLNLLKLNRKCEWSKYTNDIWEHDYTEAYKVLEFEREKAVLFLKESLGDN